MEELRKNHLASTRIDTLIDLLEKDTVGYRTERFIIAERESLASLLTENQFTLSPGATFPQTGYEERIKQYDGALQEYLPIFSLGCSLSPPTRTYCWADFMERIATCNQPGPGSYNRILSSLAFYPALSLLYSAGMMADRYQQ